jgi:NADPH-dependent curcumin reductase CurA
LTAYFGLLKAGKAKPATRTIIVSGSTVCQIAKNVLGIQKVIGITGSAEKCNTLTKQCECDISLNYKDPDFVEKLKSATPDYVDLFFDNVGGIVLDSVLQRMAKYGRVVSCGSVSSYDGENTSALSMDSWGLVVSHMIVLEEKRQLLKLSRPNFV